MKILQVIPYFVPAFECGGPVAVSYNIAKALVKKGHNVTVYTTNTLGAKGEIDRKFEIIDGIHIKRFSNLYNSMAYRSRLFFTPTMFFEIKEEMKSFDIIHMHEYRTFQNIVVHHYARKYKIPYILQAHGSLPADSPKKRLKQAYDYSCGYKILRHSSKLLALTPKEVGQYQNMGITVDKITTIPNGIDLTEFQNLPARGIFRNKYGLQDNQKLILYLGRIHKIKGLDILIKAFAEMARDLDNIKLVIAGPDDGYLTELKALITELSIENRVVLTGPLYGRDKLEAYIDAEVYVLSSIYETFPVTVLEACACGLPVVVTDRCGIANLVDGQIGLVIPYDKEYLGSAILQILSNDQMRRGFAERGRSLVREQFNWSKIAEQVEKIYLCAGKF